VVLRYRGLPSRSAVASGLGVAGVLTAGAVQSVARKGRRLWYPGYRDRFPADAPVVRAFGPATELDVCLLGAAGPLCCSGVHQYRTRKFE
jgi:hypothetical protein